LIRDCETMPGRIGTTIDSASPIIRQTSLINSSGTPPSNTSPGASIDQSGHDIEVQLQYLRDDPLYDLVKPIQITPNFLDREGRSNVRLESGPPEVLNDVRGREHEFTLDANGFCYVHAPTNCKDWSSQPQIAKEYLPELEDLLRREVDGCDEIVFYDARIRQEGDDGARVQGLSYNPFARQVHVDNTERSVLEKVRSTTDLKSDYYLSGRVRIINIWRPVKHPVYDCGLAIADGGKLIEGDVIECERHLEKTGQYWDTMGVVKYRPGYDWYYCSWQEESDVLLFKNYDSATDVQARNCLHTAFDVPPSQVPANTPTRESIEVRAFVFTHPKGLRRPSGIAAPHPLALHLERGDLKPMEEEHSITDRLRTDIDEANEVKDAVLLLRRQEIRRLEKACEAVMAERDQQQQALQQSQTLLEQAQQQVSIQIEHSDALQRKIRELEAKLVQQPALLRQQNEALSRELAEMRLREQAQADEKVRILSSDSTIVQGGISSLETKRLRDCVQGQREKIEYLKVQANGKGHEVVSRCWQDSVDEAVWRERQKDSMVIERLTREIEDLKAAQQTG